MPGTLYLVATPIGNLADITYRAVETLKSVDAIACEDTRQTRKLLEHYAIDRPLVSYHEHNETERTEDLVARLTAGANIALVSDAGTPLISDPGYRVVRACAEAGIKVVPIPGASAVLSALSASGLATDCFTFHGFAPRKSGERQREFATLAGTAAVHVYYESPHRILETLDDLEQALHNPEIVVARELTKVHEEFLRGTAHEVRSTLAARDAVRGEFTLLIGKAGAAPEIAELSVVERVAALEATGLSRMDAIKAVARERGLNKRDVYAQVEAAAPKKR